MKPFAPAAPFLFGVLSPAGKSQSLATREQPKILERTVAGLDLPREATCDVLPFTPRPWRGMGERKASSNREA